MLPVSVWIRPSLILILYGSLEPQRSFVQFFVWRPTEGVTHCPLLSLTLHAYLLLICSPFSPNLSFTSFVHHQLHLLTHTVLLRGGQCSLLASLQPPAWAEKQTRVHMFLRNFNYFHISGYITCQTPGILRDTVDSEWDRLAALMTTFVNLSQNLTFERLSNFGKGHTRETPGGKIY